ncbi:MAG: hypothetical protein BWY76_00080 [bacterium ADurb.Bin429]|nr:MAG: hypothetical protein BWY76_00080 [bacterium ADurb.Bin429]
MTATPAYDAPVDQLLKLGDPGGFREPWPNYPAMGITREQIPGLIRMASDMALIEAPVESRKYWAPLHAARALGELRAAEGVEVLIALIPYTYDDDTLGEDLPAVFGLIGAPALPALTAFLADDEQDEMARVCAAHAFIFIASFYPDTTQRCATILFKQLMRYEQHPEAVNTFLVGYLIDLGYTPAESLIRLVYKFGAIDEEMYGSVEEAIALLHDAKLREDTLPQEVEWYGFLREYLPAEPSA